MQGPENVPEVRWWRFLYISLACLGRPHRHRPSPGGIFPLSAVGSPISRSYSPSPRRHEKVKFGRESVRTFTPRDEDREESEEEGQEKDRSVESADESEQESPATPSASSVDDAASPTIRQLLTDASSTEGEVSALADQSPKKNDAAQQDPEITKIGDEATTPTSEQSSSLGKRRSFLSGLKSPRLGMGWLRSSKRTAKTDSTSEQS